MVDEAVDQGDDTGGIGEDLAPFGEGAVGRDEGGLGLVAARDDLKEQIGVTVGVGQIADLVDLCGDPHKWTNVESSVMWSLSAMSLFPS